MCNNSERVLILMSATVQQRVTSILRFYIRKPPSLYGAGVIMPDSQSSVNSIPCMIRVPGFVRWLQPLEAMRLKEITEACLTFPPPADGCSFFATVQRCHRAYPVDHTEPKYVGQIFKVVTGRSRPAQGDAHSPTCAVRCQEYSPSSRYSKK